MTFAPFSSFAKKANLASDAGFHENVETFHANTQYFLNVSSQFFGLISLGWVKETRGGY